MSVIFWAGLTQVNSSCATAKVGPNRRTRPAVRRREMGARSTLNTNPGCLDIYGPQCDILGRPNSSKLTRAPRGASAADTICPGATVLESEYVLTCIHSIKALTN